MARQEIRLVEFCSYVDDNGKDQLCEHFDVETLELQEVTPDTIERDLGQRVLVPYVKAKTIENWLEDPSEPLYLGSGPYIPTTCTDVSTGQCNDLVCHHELEHRTFIIPPFGPLAGKRIMLS